MMLLSTIMASEPEPNDKFYQLVDNAAAAIDAVDKLGYINRKKSCRWRPFLYGALTANLFTHSDLLPAELQKWCLQ
jgi:hypothetical protein